MRVYTRGVDEGLMIGETVQINVLEVQTNCVRLAIIDPGASPSYREELLYVSTEMDDEPLQVDSVSVFSHEEDFCFTDEDSRLIPMA